MNLAVTHPLGVLLRPSQTILPGSGRERVNHVLGPCPLSAPGPRVPRGDPVDGPEDGRTRTRHVTLPSFRVVSPEQSLPHRPVSDRGSRRTRDRDSEGVRTGSVRPGRVRRECQARWTTGVYGRIGDSRTGLDRSHPSPLSPWIHSTPVTRPSWHNVYPP